MPKGIKNNITPEQEKLLNIPTVLLSPDNLIFIDRLGNQLERGQIIIYAGANSELRMGVFIGLAERSFKTEKYQGYGKPYICSAHREKQIGFATEDMLGVTKTFWQKYDETEYNGICQLKKFMVIHKPEFYVDELDVARCFALADELKDGILKDIK